MYYRHNILYKNKLKCEFKMFSDNLLTVNCIKIKRRDALWCTYSKYDINTFLYAISAKSADNLL